MKKPPSISPTDLARIAPLPEYQQRFQLDQLKRGYPPFTYGHTRSVLSALMNMQDGQLLEHRELSWEEIEAALCRKCKQGDEIKYNRMAAEALYRFAKKHEILGRRDDDGGFGRMPLGQGHDLVLWENGVVRWDNRPHVLFVDLRSTKHLSEHGRRFAFSAQHEQIRQRDPNMAGAGLLILHVRSPVEKKRHVTPYTDAGVDLYSFEELDLMTRRTYELWEEIYFGRVEEERRKASGDIGPLFKR